MPRSLVVLARQMRSQTGLFHAGLQPLPGTDWSENIWMSATAQRAAEGRSRAARPAI